MKEKKKEKGVGLVPINFSSFRKEKHDMIRTKNCGY
jgi:hypothetical protein